MSWELLILLPIGLPTLAFLTAYCIAIIYECLFEQENKI